MIANYKGKPVHLLFLNRIESLRDGGSISITIRMKMPDSRFFEDKTLVVDSAFYKQNSGRMYWGHSSKEDLVDDPEFEKAVISMVDEHVSRQVSMYEQLKKDYRDGL